MTDGHSSNVWKSMFSLFFKTQLKKIIIWEVFALTCFLPVLMLSYQTQVNILHVGAWNTSLDFPTLAGSLVDRNGIFIDNL